MRKKQILAILIVLIIVNVATISMALLITGETKNDLNLNEDLLNSLTIRDYKPVDGTHGLEGKTTDDLPFLSGLIMSTTQPSTTDSWFVNCSDDFYGGIYEQEFDCVLEGVHCNIWIGLNPDVWPDGFQDEYVPGDCFENDTWYFAYPWSSIGIDAVEAGAPDPDGDGYYLPPEYRDWITGADLIEIKDEFDNNIHDSVVDHFGEYMDRPGPLGDYKIQVLIFNMRDGLFYEPIEAGWFIMGYFWSKISEENNANIFHMDTYQWWRRQGHPTESFYGLGPLPVQYEGTFAHEFQHLIHYDVDSDELSWVNEGCSVLAEWICGYGFPAGHISEYLLYWWDTSLVIWQGTLADYGVVFLWTFYMWEHYGGDALIWDLVHHQDNGIEAWNDLLINEGYGNGKDFDAIFQDWALANYLDDTSIEGGIYGYYELDIPSEDTEGFSISLAMELWQSGSNMPFFDWLVNNYPASGIPYPYGSSLPYVVNYVRFYKEGASHILTVEFDGDDTCGVSAHDGDYKWHSGGDAWAWFRLGQTFTIPEGGATLSFWNNFEIELDWDYGYVEVHDLTDDEWYTLPGTMTVADVGFNYQTDNPNCPYGFEPTDYYDADRWHAFTGSSGGWYQEFMDLTMFAGHDIELYFTYWTDPYTLEAGWYIDDISIPEIGFSDTVEDEEHGWTIYDGWFRSDILFENDFNVNFINIFNEYGKNGVLVESTYFIESMSLNPETEIGLHEAPLIDIGGYESYSVMVVANQPGFEHTHGSSYSFSADVHKVEGYEWLWCWLFRM
ncbi:MAG: immune inhibitor A [Candidatus Lokiarchaeota archaeon]|nr:immune inhibitor A [Candidatus Lokiarchaeota archaeon]